MKQISTPEPYTTVQGIAETFGVSRWTIAKVVRQMMADDTYGRRVFRIGRQYRLRISDFEAYARSVS